MYKLEVSQQEVQLILGALSELPLKISVNLFGNIQKQVTSQDEENAIPIDTLMATADQRKGAL